MNPNPLSRNRYFKGDDRGFDPNGESFRTRVDIELAYDLERSPLYVHEKNWTFDCISTVRNVSGKSDSAIRWHYRCNGQIIKKAKQGFI